ncbi:MAG TPA: hypothetical protein VL283_02055 [Candidatus Baltobacteraceae bacterium]|nr:hypothetical protein [Candidatus Baltobacteraceae bacterium]
MHKLFFHARVLIALAILAVAINGNFGTGFQVAALVILLTAYRKNAARALRSFFEDEEQRRPPPQTEAGRSRTAFHEAAHAVVGWVLPTQRKPSGASIEPDDDSLGRVHHLLESRDVHDMETALNELAIMFAGSAAEREFCTPKSTAGWAGDLDMATQLAERMVCEWGFSGKLPRRRYDPCSGLLTEEILKIINEEIDRFLEMGEALALKTVKAHHDAVGRVAALLMQFGSLDQAKLRAAIENSG